MSAETRTQLDESTKAELQPPCELSLSNPSRPCPLPAAWVMRFQCGNKETHRTPKMLVCASHCAQFVGGNTRSHCPPCDAKSKPIVLLVEPLR